MGAGASSARAAAAGGGGGGGGAPTNPGLGEAGAGRYVSRLKVPRDGGGRAPRVAVG